MKKALMILVLLIAAVKSHGQERITSNDIEQVINQQNQTHTVIVATLKIKKGGK